MRNRSFLWSAIVIGAAALLGGCVGEPQTFSTAKPVSASAPIALGRRVAVRTSARPAASVLSRAEKERLFQEFQRSRGLKAATVSVEEERSP